MKACRDYEGLLAERAAGGLAPQDAVRLGAHLESCAACRAEAGAFAEAIALVRLPAPSGEERRALAGLPKRALGEIHAAERRRLVGRKILVGVAAAAAATLFVLAPAAFRDRSRLAGSVQPAPVAVATAWTAPDPDTLWEETALLEEESSSGTGASDAALSAFDAGEGL